MAYRIATLLLTALVVWAEEDWISQCRQCKCMWSDGRKTADCRNAYLTVIPTFLHQDIRGLDLSNNQLYEVGARAFFDINLHNTQKLRLQNCSLQHINTQAFSKMGNLVELDLSKNSITELHEDTFRDNIKLRILFLNHNQLTVLNGSLFHNMTHLQRIEISDNKLHYVDSHIFNTGDALQFIDLSINRLKHLSSDFLKNLNRLSSLNVQGNPWICDCKLQKFRDLAVEHNLVTAPTTCLEPERLKGSEWRLLRSRDFACIPVILEPTANRQLLVDSPNFTITCKVRGDPVPDVEWLSHGRIIDSDPRRNSQKYITASNMQEDDIIWSNLTIINVNYRDRGEYKCVAKNPGGTDERNVSLIIIRNYAGGGSSDTSSTLALPWIIGLSASAIFLLIVIFLLICYCCKRTTRQSRTKGGDMNQSNDYISLNGRPEMEKSLITEVNPLVKPPRQYSVPPSVTSGVTEVSDVKKILLDDDSTLAGDDESRSFDFESRPVNKSQTYLDIDYRGDSQLPPDLLAFPTRITQVSPAGSTASTVADHSRLPTLHGPQSPLHSPLYDAPGLYRTLPHSRSQSPFSTPFGAPVITPRQGGYVTIPRRPRASWSSDIVSPLTGDPVYDNLGLRTGASGSSVLSLNKIGEAATPKGGRPVLTSTQTYPCDPIAEHDSPPTAATLPRSMSAQRAFTPTLDNHRGSWLRNTPENSSMRSSGQPDSRRESTASLLPATPDAKIAKIPPRPPPKPKKRSSTGPLFEDEGEDGTEV